MFQNNQKYLFIYAHLDDETILSYGTIQKLIENNKIVKIIIFAGNGREFRKFQNIRQKAFIELYKNIDVKTYEFFDLNIDKEQIESIIKFEVNEFKPDVVLTHSVHDLHFEHRLIAEKTLLICRHLNNNIYSPKMLLTSVTPAYYWSYSQYGSFSPNIYVDISQYIKEKEHALTLYSYELTHEDEHNLKTISGIVEANKFYGLHVNKDSCEVYQLIFQIT